MSNPAEHIHVPLAGQVSWPISPTSIRLGTPSDAAAISHLIGSTWAKYFGYSVSPSDLETYLSTSLSVTQMEQDLSNPRYTFLLSTSPLPQKPSLEDTGTTTDIPDEQAVLGVVILVKNTSEPCLTLPSPLELARLYVDSSQHGTGLAGSLVASAEEHARKAGYGSLWLGVWEDNSRGKRFYEKMGFRECGEHYFYVGQSKRRDLVLEKAL